MAHTSPQSDQGILGSDLLQVATIYYTTSVFVMLGVIFGLDFAANHSDTLACQRSPSTSVTDAFIGYEGGLYRELIARGYPYQASNEIFRSQYPIYPGICWLLTKTGLSFDFSMLFVSNISLFASFALFANYLNDGKAFAYKSRSLLMLGLYPLGFRMRMASPDSLMLLVTLLFMLGIRRKWSFIFLSLLIGIGAGIRLSGLAMFLPFYYRLWLERTSLSGFIAKVIITAALGCSGIALLGIHFSALGTCLKNTGNIPSLLSSARQGLPQGRASEAGFQELGSTTGLSRDSVQSIGKELCKVRSLITIVLFSTFFAATIVAYKYQHLNAAESMLCVGLLIFLSIETLDEASPMSALRSVSMIFPAFILLGKVTSRVSNELFTLFYAILATALGVFSTLHAAGYILP